MRTSYNALGYVIVMHTVLIFMTYHDRSLSFSCWMPTVDFKGRLLRNLGGGGSNLGVFTSYCDLGMTHGTSSMSSEML